MWAQGATFYEIVKTNENLSTKLVNFKNCLNQMNLYESNKNMCGRRKK